MRTVRALDADDDSAAADDRGADAVIVEAEDGERFALTVDDALRRAVDAAAPAPVQAPARPAHPLSPREIQVRVRAGESPQELAADSGTPLDKIMRFAQAVLEERVRIGDEARRGRARRDGDGGLVPFGETVDQRFTAHGIDPSSVAWDSFRRPDGSWVVIATWTAGGTQRRAHWAFSLAARTVLPADEIGSDLLSDRPLRPVVRAVPDRDDFDQPPRYDEAYAELYDQDAPSRPASAAFSAASRAATPSSPPSPPSPETAPLRLAEPMATAPTPLDPDSGFIGLDDLFGRSDDAGSARGSAASATASASAEETAPPGPAGSRPTGAEPVESEPADAEPPDRRRSNSRSKAAREQTRIPSWDDILLGVRRKQD